MGRSDLISIIIPVYNEEKQIRESIQAIGAVLQKNSISYEFILVDDGSKDNTWAILMDLAASYPGMQVIRFSRNFGKEAALCAGLDAARGDAALIMDADLQHPPEFIPEMIRLWKTGYEIVEGVKSSRGREKLSNRFFARVFYDMMQRLSGFDLHNASDFKLLDAKVVAAWRQMPERHTFFRGMAAWVGFQRTAVSFEVPERPIGGSKWSKLHLFKLAMTAITSFSSIPLQIVTFLGIIFLLGAIPLIFQTLYLYFHGDARAGFTTVIVLLLIIGSILMISLGIIGMYIAKIFEEVKFRPRYLITEKLEHRGEEPK